MLCLGPVAGGGETEVLKLLDVLLSTEVEAQKKQKVLQEEFYKKHNFSKNRRKYNVAYRLLLIKN